MSDDANPKDRIGTTKPQLHLVPAALSIHVARAMEDGAAKYGAYNWRGKKVRATVYISAMLRHLLDYLDGEDCAEDSGVHHLGHAAACAVHQPATTLNLTQHGTGRNHGNLVGRHDRVVRLGRRIVAARQPQGDLLRQTRIAARVV